MNPTPCRLQTICSHYSPEGGDTYVSKVRAELERMKRLGVVRRVQQPTDWFMGMVVVPRPGGKVRICVDLTCLNESVYRERHLPAVEQTLAQLAGASVFTKLDANSGFWRSR